MVKEMGFSGPYIETLTPVERDLHIMYHKEIEKKKAEQKKLLKGMNLGLPPANMGDSNG